MSLPFLNTAPGYDEELRNSVFFERGPHATSICGAVGAAASMGAGLLEANRTGGTVKRVHCGWAAHCGVAAADLARHGLTGPPTVMEGRFGFLQAFCGDRAHPDAVVRGLGTDSELPRQRREVPPGGARGRARGPNARLPDAQSVEDLTALLTSAGER
jgi:hypothetical protein